jgi:hypothetical protein
VAGVVEDDPDRGAAGAGLTTESLDAVDQLIGEGLGSALDVVAAGGEVAALGDDEGKPPHLVGIIGVVHEVCSDGDLEGLVAAEGPVQHGGHRLT